MHKQPLECREKYRIRNKRNERKSKNDPAKAIFNVEKIRKNVYAKGEGCKGVLPFPCPLYMIPKIIKVIGRKINEKPKGFIFFQSNTFDWENQ